MVFLKIIFLTTLLTLAVLTILAIPYLGWIFVNYILLSQSIINQKARLAQAQINTNNQITTFIEKYLPTSASIDIFDWFYSQLVMHTPKLGMDVLNCTRYENAIQRDKTDFIIWFSKYPDSQTLDDWKRQLRQIVRSYDNNQDVLFTEIQEGAFIKLKVNLVSVDYLNHLENAQFAPLFNEDGEV